MFSTSQGLCQFYCEAQIFYIALKLFELIHFFKKLSENIKAL